MNQISSQEEEPIAETVPEAVTWIPETMIAEAPQVEPVAEVTMEEEPVAVLAVEEKPVESIPVETAETTLGEAISPATEQVPAVQPQKADIQSLLDSAKEDLRKDAPAAAASKYRQVVESGERLEEAIHDLREALYRYPIDIDLWQTLGEAYFKGNHLQDALDAFTKAEEFLR